MKSIIEEASSIVKAIEAAWIRAEKPHEFSVKIFEEPEKNFFGMVTKSAKIALIFKHVEKRLPKDQTSAKYKQPEPTISTMSAQTTKDYSRKESPRRESAPRERDRYEPREPREPREHQDRREPREMREMREPREPREPRENREHREPREYQERREPRDRYEAREPREHQERREPREPREMREPREPREHQERREPMVRELVRKEVAPKPAAPVHEREITHAPRERDMEAPDQEGKEKTFWTEEMIEIARTWIETLLKNLKCEDIKFTLEPKRYYLSVTFEKPLRETKALEQQLFRSCAYLIMQMLRTKLKKQFRGLKVVLSTPA